MTRLARLAARLYPHVWSTRYAEEFDALLDDVDMGWRDVLDITVGAMTMQIRVHGLVLAGCTMLGALAGMVISLQITPLYYSSAILRLRPGDVDARSRATPPPRVFDEVVASAFTDSSIEQLGRSEGLIPTSPGSMHDAIGRIRSATFVKLLPLEDDARAQAVEIGFKDPDRGRSERVRRRLLDLLITENFAQRSSVTMQVVSSPAVPTSSRPDQVAVISASAVVGMLIGVVALMTRKSVSPA
jgi:hypothetical protein